MPGDRILEVNGEALTNDTAGVNRMIQVIQSGDMTQPIELAVDRGGEKLSYSMTPAPVTDEGGKTTRYQIGIVFSSRTYNFLRNPKKYYAQGFNFMLNINYRF
jgi:hypothetical protein